MYITTMRRLTVCRALVLRTLFTQHFPIRASYSTITATNRQPQIHVSTRRGARADPIPDPVTIAASPTYKYLMEWAKAHPSKAIELTADCSTLGDIPNYLNKAESGGELRDIVGKDTGVVIGWQSGWLVEVRSDDMRTPMLGVVVGVKEGKYWLAMRGGKFARVVNVEDTFKVPDFAEKKEYEELLQYLPKNEDVVTNLNEFQPKPGTSAELMERLKKFQDRADDWYRLNLSAFNKSYKELADREELKYLTLPQIAEVIYRISHDERMEMLKKKARGDPSVVREPTREELKDWKSPEALYAVHRYLLSHDKHAFSLTRATGLSGEKLYEILPTTWARDIEFTENQVRIYMEALGGNLVTSKVIVHHLVPYNDIVCFLERAREAIVISRKSRWWSAAGIVSPLIGNPEKKQIQWKGNDTRFLRFMEIWAAYEGLRRGSEMTAVGMAILRLLGEYRKGKEYWEAKAGQENTNEPAKLNSSLAWSFLVEVGWKKPWDLQARYATRFPGMTAISERQDNSGYLRQLKADFEGANREDVANSRRRSWKEANVFAIDEPSTTLIDDAVSVENIPDNSDTWVHVHVADPAAFLEPKSKLAKWIEALPQNLYLAGYHENMFPDEFFAGTIMGKFSLGNGKPCLTFSARVSEDGQIKAVDITPGTLGELICIRGEEIVKVAPAKHTDIPLPPITEYSVGPKPQLVESRTMADSTNLTPSQVADLQTLQTLGDALTARRAKAGALTSFPERPTVKVGIPESANKDVYIHISYDNSGASGRVVAPHMVLAGEVAARWCAERGIPAPFRAQPQAKDNWLDICKKLEEGSITLLEAFTEVGPIVLQAKIGKVPIMGVNGYVKVTSPLRRYADLLCHWQVHNALASEEKSKSVYGDKEFGDMLTSLRSREKLARQLERMEGDKQWILAALYRGWYFKEAKIPSRFKWTVTALGNGQILGELDWFGLRAGANVRGFTEGGVDVRFTEVQVGDVFEVELGSVDVVERDVRVNVCKKV